jgi:tetratricopeptide (TPR) repeat protein
MIHPSLMRYSRMLVILAVLLVVHAVRADSIALYSYEQGVSLAAQGKFDEAQASFEQALKEDPHNYPVRRCLSVLTDFRHKRIKEQTALTLFRAFSAFNRSRPDEALKDLNKTAELDPDYPLIYSHRGDVYLEKGRPREALADYNKALEIDPTYAAGYVSRGNFYAGQSQFNLAIADFDRALQIEPGNIPATYSRGNVYGQQGRFDAAIADYTRLLDINPLYPHAYVRKGLAYEKSGRIPDALAAYKAYLEKLNLRDQDPRQVKWVQDKVKSLEKQP